MGVYIEDMKKPENCMNCKIIQKCSYCDDCNDKCFFQPENVRTTWNFCDEIYPEAIPDWCPLIEVPEQHGDLIDRDAFISRLDEGKEIISMLKLPEDFREMYNLVADGMKEELIKCPVIIPASKDGE